MPAPADEYHQRVREERDSLRAEVERLRAELAKCGKENCMGRKLEGSQTWVTLEAKEKVDRENDRLRARVAELEACERVLQLQAKLFDIAMADEQGKGHDPT